VISRIQGYLRIILENGRGKEERKGFIGRETVDFASGNCKSPFVSHTSVSRKRPKKYGPKILERHLEIEARDKQRGALA
jgi:hypothetical protein